MNRTVPKKDQELLLLAISKGEIFPPSELERARKEVSEFDARDFLYTCIEYLNWMCTGLQFDVESIDHLVSKMKNILACTGIEKV